MPYSVPFVKVTVEGHFGLNGTTFTEFWNAGFHLTKNAGVIGGTTELTAFLSAIRTPIINYHTAATVASGGNTYVDAVSGAYIGTDGKYALGALQSTTRVALATPQVGAGSASMPWSSACCITLRSLLTRGPASHGRIYWPRAGGSIDLATGVILPATVTTMSAAAKTLLDAINTSAAGVFGTGCNVGLVSPYGSGFQSPVVRAGIGSKMDSMESRERNLSEAHVFNNLTVSTALLEQLDEDFKDKMRDEFPDAD